MSLTRTVTPTSVYPRRYRTRPTYMSSMSRWTELMNERQFLLRRIMLTSRPSSIPSTSSLHFRIPTEYICMLTSRRTSIPSTSSLKVRGIATIPCYLLRYASVCQLPDERQFLLRRHLKYVASPLFLVIFFSLYYNNFHTATLSYMLLLFACITGK